MSLLDKAKSVMDKVTESITEFSSDDIIAQTIIKAIEKKDKVNALLKEKGLHYRISDINLEMSIPPAISFGVRRLGDAPDKVNESTKVVESGNEV